MSEVPFSGPTQGRRRIAYKRAGNRASINSKAEEFTRPRRTVTAPKENLWDTLSNNEVSQLIDWLYEPKQGLNLTHHDNATHWDNFIGVTELIPPNKTDALAYLEDKRPAPARYARVVLFRGASEDPYVHEIKV